MIPDISWLGREDGDRDGLHGTEIPYEFRFPEPDFKSQPSGDGFVPTLARLRAALTHAQQAQHQSGHTNAANITFLCGVLGRLGFFISHYCF